MDTNAPQLAPPTNTSLAEPFSQIFVDRDEATWAFDLLLDTVKRLGMRGPNDTRFALTLPQQAGKLCLHLNFGQWLVLGFRGPSLTAPRVEMALLADRVAWNERFVTLPSARKEGDPEVRSYHLPLETVRPMTSDLRAAYEATLNFIAGRFHAWKRSPYWKQHHPEIVEALFDPDKRAQLFAGLLAETDLRYERHFTAFHQEIGEEEGSYEIGTTLAEESQITPVYEFDLHRRSDMNLSHDEMEERLKIAFTQFNQNPYHLFIVKLRRKRAEQIRKLLSIPDTLELETFNREIWVGQSATYLHGKSIKIEDEESFDSDIEQALDADELELHGNYIWGTASRIYAPRLKDDTQKVEYIRQALHILNNPDLTPIQKTQQINKIYGFGNNITTGLVMLFHPTEFGLYNEAGKQILKNLGYEIGDSLDTYEEILHILKDKLHTKDFLELDHFLYVFNQEQSGPSDKTTSVETKTTTETDLEFPSVPLSSPYPLSQLSSDTGLDETELSRWLRAIERKGQVILYGPPGTGKTFVAQKLAQHLVGGGDGFVDLVQFHPAYAYEDFIQGLRPQARPDGGLDYPLVPGRFLDFCRQAALRRDCCVLIIDEINRANLARVFGELMYLLEYRDQEIPLAGGGLLRLPANVRLIATMNTADRSIALVDHALRRRFAFIALAPNFDILRRYHQKTGCPVEKLIELLARLNRAIDDPHYAVGITFFLREDFASQLEDIWRMEIEPYLEEYFFDQPDKVAEFRWEIVKPKMIM